MQRAATAVSQLKLFAIKGRGQKGHVDIFTGLEKLLYCHPAVSAPLRVMAQSCCPGRSWAESRAEQGRAEGEDGHRAQQRVRMATGAHR